MKRLSLDDGYARGKHTPAETKPLVKDSDGAPAAEGFSYSSVVGMLLYLSGHTRSDITYTVNCCARYMFCPNHSHELALKRIGRYLKATATCGMIINPTRELSIDAYPDADFAGMYGHENPTDPACAKSCTGFVIVFSGVPVIVGRSRYVLLTVRYEYNKGGKCSRIDHGILEILKIQYLWSEGK